MKKLVTAALLITATIAGPASAAPTAPTALRQSVVQAGRVNGYGIPSIMSTPPHGVDLDGLLAWAHGRVASPYPTPGLSSWVSPTPDEARTTSNLSDGDVTDIRALWPAGDVTGDGYDDLIVIEARDGGGPGETYAVTLRAGADGSRAWSIPLPQDSFLHVWYGDLTGDGASEVGVYALGDEPTDEPGTYKLRQEFTLYEPVDGSIRWSRSFPGHAKGIEVAGVRLVSDITNLVTYPLFMEDASGDGVSDFFAFAVDYLETPAAYVVQAKRAVTFSGSDGADVATWDMAGYGDFPLPVLDVSGDGLADLVVYTAGTLPGDVRMSAHSVDGTVHWSVPVPRSSDYWFGARLAGATSSDIVDFSFRSNGEVRVYDGRTGALRWSKARDYQRRVPALWDDVDGDGGADLIDLPWFDTSAEVSALSGATGETLWSANSPMAGDVAWPYDASDLDGDGLSDPIIEFGDSTGFGSSSYWDGGAYTAYRATGGPSLWTFDPARYEAPRFFPLHADATGDGKEDVATVTVLSKGEFMLTLREGTALAAAGNLRPIFGYLGWSALGANVAGDGRAELVVAYAALAPPYSPRIEAHSPSLMHWRITYG